MTDKLKEAISMEADLLLKLTPLPEPDIFEFMQNLRGGTYFNMGMYNAIPVAKAYKATIRIYKVVDLAAIVSGVSYENIATTKDFRDRTGEGPGGSWYDHLSGFENKVGVKKSDPNCKYVLWDIKKCTDTCVRYYVVDIATGAVAPVTKEDVLNSTYLTQTEKNKLLPRPVTGFDLTTGAMVENKTVWRTAAFDHIFWLSQNGKTTKEYGTRFVECMISEELQEAHEADLFIDGHFGIDTDLDAILAGNIVEAVADNTDNSTADKKHFYVVCLIDDKIVAHGIQTVDLSALSKHETPEEFAMTEFFDGTEIAYNGEYDDENGEFDWDRLTRYVGELSETELDLYKNLSDEEIMELVNDAKSTLVAEAVLKDKKAGPRTRSFLDNDLFVDFE